VNQCGAKIDTLGHELDGDVPHLRLVGGQLIVVRIAERIDMTELQQQIKPQVTGDLESNGTETGKQEQPT
jgi:hypothetical protein